MKFIVKREDLLKPLQQISGPVGGRPTLAILRNILLQVMKNHLLLTSTDLEIEMISLISLSMSHECGAITVPARKFFDIFRNLPEKAEVTVILKDERILIFSGRSRYSLATLPASDYPNLGNWKSKTEFTLPQSILKRLLESTQFSMAHQDVRYYLNGMLFEIKDGELCTVATDGHRLAVCCISFSTALPYHSVIVPRKGIIELIRILDGSEKPVHLQISSNHIRAHIGTYIFTSKLIDGHFPDYRRILPKNPDKVIEANCDTLKQAFSRVAILSNEKFRSVRLSLSLNQLKITTKNPEQEEAEEILDVAYEGAAIETGFNVSYILDVLKVLKCKAVRLRLTNETSSMQIEDSTNQLAFYVIMPMRL